MTSMKLYRIARNLHLKKIPIFPRIITRLNRVINSCEIPYTAEIHSSVTLAHRGLGVVIGHDTVIGEKTKILQNVTIGGRKGIRANPIIGSNVLIGAGACILGNIKVGDNVKIGANSVVIQDIPDNCTAVGVPARVIEP